MSINNNISKFANTVDSSGQIDFADLANKPTTLAGYGITDGSSGGSVTSYTNASDLPLSGNSAGDLAYVVETNRMYVNTGSGWYSISLVNTDPSITSVQDANSNTTPFTLSTDGTATVITITASDPENVPLTYSYSVTSGSLTNGGGTTATVTQGTGSNTNVFTVTPSTTEAYAGTFTLTFTVSDGINTSTSGNAFSLSFITTITNSQYTTYLLKADASASDNQADASSNSLTITESGNVTSTAFTPYHPKGYSTYFDGSDDYLSIANSSQFGFASNDITIEAWIYWKTAPTSYKGIFSTLNSNNTSVGVTFATDSNGYLTFSMNSDLASDFTSNTTGFSFTENVWYHLALVRTSNTVKIFVDGQQEGSNITNSSNLGSSNPAVVGRIYTDFNDHYPDAYIADLRVVNGTAVYTSAFTPPTERLEAITNTKLLTCHLPYIADGSSNDLSITVNGNPKTQQFSPYDNEEYTKSSYGGSVYFDGVGDYISAAHSNNLVQWWTDDFTLEMWVYPNALNQTSNAQPTANVHGDPSGATNYWSFGPISNGTIKWYYYQGSIASLSTTQTIPAKTWSHLAFTFDYSTSTMKIYINGVEGASGTLSGTPQSSASYNLAIGHGSGTGFNGYISDFRVVKGTVVYTADFTPTTASLTAITNTQLLTCTNKHEIWDAATGRKLQMINTPEASTTQYKWSNSIYFDDTAAIYSDLDEHGGVGTRDYTWEAWVYSTNITQEQALFAFGTYNPGLYIDTSSNIVHVDAGTGQQVNTAHGMSSNTWYHVAACRDGTNLRVFIDGTQVGSTGTGYNIDIPRDTLRIGAYETGASYRWIGYMEDVRLTIGLARYTSNFTVPSEAFKG